jgi:spore maturation protein CgeB
MQDYVSFESPSDLVDKIRHYLDHDDEREEIAARGEQKVRQIYNSEHFWKAIFNKLEEVRTVPL